MLSFLRRAAGAVALAAICAPTFAGAPLVAPNGFEAPDYGVGPLEGQQDWIVLSLGGGGSSATVQSDRVRSGDQALRVDRAELSDKFWLQPGLPEQSGRFVSIDWEMWVDPVTSRPQAFGPFFGLNVFDDSSGPVLQLAGFGVDAASREILFQQPGGIFQSVGPATLGQWVQYRIELDFVADTFRGFVDGQFVASSAFVNSGVSRLTDVDIVALTGAGDIDSQRNEGVAYIDNLLIRDGVRADFNGDGHVNAIDYTLWREATGQSGFGLSADGDADGLAGPSDYTLWSSSFGLSNAVTTLAVTTPEPAAWVIAVATLSVACTRRD